jgi:hypothetical protein
MTVGGYSERPASSYCILGHPHHTHVTPVSCVLHVLSKIQFNSCHAQMRPTWHFGVQSTGLKVTWKGPEAALVEMPPRPPGQSLSAASANMTGGQYSPLPAHLQQEYWLAVTGAPLRIRVCGRERGRRGVGQGGVFGQHRRQKQQARVWSVRPLAFHSAV